MGTFPMKLCLLSLVNFSRGDYVLSFTLFPDFSEKARLNMRSKTFRLSKFQPKLLGRDLPMLSLPLTENFYENLPDEKTVVW